MPSTAQHGPPERANGCTRREERQWRPIRQAVGEQALAILRSSRKRGRVEQNGLRSRAEVEAGPDRKRWPGRAEVSFPENRFAPDSPLEEAGFELSVPPREGRFLLSPSSWSPSSCGDRGERPKYLPKFGFVIDSALEQAGFEPSV